MIPSSLEACGEEQRDRRSVRPLTAVYMYERLKRMSTEHGLNLSPEDLLASAYLGHNLVYTVQSPIVPGCGVPEDGTDRVAHV